ncbi:urease accessory protein UreE [Acidithiobacillus caldus]
MKTLITRKRSPANPEEKERLTVLHLVAEDRERARQQLPLADGRALVLQLPRGTVLLPQDVLCTGEGVAVAIVAAEPEPVYTLRAADSFALLRAAYHLGNRHVAMELAPDYLRIKPDPVLAHLLEQLSGVDYVEEIAPFVPDSGAYRTNVHPHG